MSKPVLLDLYCCQGGASAGYQAAGFDVVGCDLSPQPRYRHPFIREDALSILRRLLRGDRVNFLGDDSRDDFDGDRQLGLEEISAVHASPPCQAHTNAQKIQGNAHPDLIAPTRELLGLTGVPYVIENVPGSPVREDLVLCGEMFGLATYRHRIFELGGWAAQQPEHPDHLARTAKMGRPPKPGEYMHIVGNFSGVQQGKEVMGMPWANRDGLREAIPPAYTEYIGRHLIDHLPAPLRRGFFMPTKENH